MSEAKKTGYQKKRGSGLYLSMFNLIAEAINPIAAREVRRAKNLQDKLKLIMEYITSLHTEINILRNEKQKEKTRIEDLTLQLGHIARDHQAAVDGFHESIRENNRNMEDAMKERERIIAEADDKLKTAREEIFCLEVRRDELACHRMFLMAQLSWYKKTYGDARATMRVDITQQNA
jgi:chromosome segregation ATPase